jgi:SHS2 domain-containing protein
MKQDFEIIEHTADVGIRAYGESQAEAYANAARGMFSLIAELDTIRPNLSRQVKVEGSDCEDLLVAWLNELIFLFETQRVLFSRFDIKSISDTHLQARCRGEKVDPHRHEIKIGIKSATYHMLKVEQNAGWQVQVILDI